jgi:hypothetical protein
MKMKNVSTVISELGDFIKSEGMNHHLFEWFLSDVETEYGDVLCCTEVCWVSRGWMFKHIWLDARNWIVSGSEGEIFSSTLLSRLDVQLCILHRHHSTHECTELYLQGTSHHTNEMLDERTAFERKLRLWELQLRSSSMAHFPIQRSKKPFDGKVRAKKFSFFNKNLSPVFKILILKYDRSQLIFNGTWRIYYKQTL